MTTIANTVLADNAYGTLSVGIATTDASITLTTGHGARFPAVASPNVLYCCLIDTANNIEEIQITTHTAGSDTLSVSRAKGSTTAKTWSSGDRIEARLSSSVLYDLFYREVDEVNIFQFLTRAQIADIRSYTGSIDISTQLAVAESYCYNSGNGPQRTLYFPAGLYLLNSGVTMRCSMRGDGPFENGTGTVFKWGGSGAIIFNFPLYVTGWKFEGFRVDMSNVTTDTIAMKFALGLVGATFRDLEFKGSHSGSSFGGTYKNHDGILVIGGSGASKYDFANCTFDHVFFPRCRHGVYQDADPAGGGPGSSIVFRNCFAWVSGNAIKLFGANNVIENFEINYEASTHGVVQSGQYASNWTYIGSNFQSAESTSGNEPVHADTSGSSNIATFIGGTLEVAADASGVPTLVLDAGAGSGRTQRYLTYGMNNVDSNTLNVDALTAYSGILASRNLTAGGATQLRESLAGSPVSGSIGAFRSLTATLNDQVAGNTSGTFSGGFFIVVNTTDKTAALFVNSGSNATSILTSTGSNWSTTYNASSKEGIAYDGSTGPLLFSNLGGSKVYQIFCFGGA